MKRLLILILALALACPAYAADTAISGLTDLAAKPASDDEFALVDSSTGVTKKVDFSYMNDITNVDVYGGLTAAVASVGATATTLLVDTAQTVTDNLSIPTTMQLIIFRSGTVTISAGKVLTVNGDVQVPGNHNWALGTGTVASTKIFRTSDTEALRIDSSQRLLVGDTASRTVAGNTPSLQINGTGGADSAINVIRSSANANGPVFVLGKSRGSALGTYDSLLSDNDILGDIQFAGADTGDFLSIGASIKARINGTIGAANDFPTELVFSTTADGLASPTERVYIHASGNVSMGTVFDTSALGVYDNNAGYAVKIWNDGNEVNRNGIELWAGADSPGDTTKYISFMDGDGGERGEIEESTGLKYSTTSDRRMKENIVDTAVNGIDVVNNIRVVDFNWKDGGAFTSAGFIAQELKEAFADAATGDETITREYEAERARGNIVATVTEEILPADAFEDIEVEEVTEVVDKIEKIKKLNIDGTVTEVDKPKYKTKKVTKRQLKEGVRFDEKTGKVYWKHEVVVEENVDQRDYNRNKKDLGRWVKTADPVMGTRDKMMGVSRERLVPVLVKALQEETAARVALQNAFCGEHPTNGFCQ